MHKRSISLLAAATVAGLGFTTSTPLTANASGDPITWSVQPEQVKAPFMAHRPSALPTPSQCVASYGFACYTPADIRSAYDIPDTIAGQAAGTGRTIMIVDAYGSPTAQADLDTFSATMGIPSTTLNVYTPEGVPDWSAPTDTQNGWAGETSLDVQWAHAIAPGATIDLVVSPDPSESLDQAMRWGLANLDPDTVSMSYGDPEWDWVHDKQARAVYATDSAAYKKATRSGTTLFASSGDAWSDNGNGTSNFASPADDANVVAVGGTNLNDGLDPSVADETVWNDYDGCLYGCSAGVIGGTGGAPSIVTDKRGSDVSYDASVYTGVLVYDGYYANPDDNGFYFTGGTSASSPQWAALIADADQATGHRLGNIRPALGTWARSSALRDVTVGDNASATYTKGYPSKRGWDIPTGYGTPDGSRVIALAAGRHVHMSGPHLDPAHRGRLH